jgi:hypothetical protein
MAELYNKDLITFLKKNKNRVLSGDIKEREACEASGIEPTKIGPALWQGEPVAVPEVKFKATKANIVRARKDGIRWERIARRADISVGEAKEIGGKEADIYTGRGTRANGNGSTAKPKGKAASGRRSKANTTSTATSGRRGKSSASNKPTPVRARTRQERQAKAGSPK